MNIQKAIQSAFEHYQAGELHEAEHICKTILSWKNDHAGALHLIGIVYYQLGNHELAVEYISRGVRSDPANADGYYNLGNAFLDMSRYEEAIQCFRKAVQLDPGIAEAYNNMGFAIQQGGKSAEALSYFRKAIQINPFFADAFYNLGNALKEEGNYDEALEYYQKAIEIDRNFIMAYYCQGQIHHLKKQFARATAFYRKAIELNPSNPEIYTNTGIAFQKQGEFDEAIICYEKALLIDPHFQQAMANMGNALHRKGRYDRARDYYQKALRYNPEDPDVRFNISLIDLVEGKYKEGWKGYEWRWKLKDFQKNSFPQPLWDGSDIQGLTLLLHVEQGYGDAIQFIRYVPLVAEKCAKVIVKCMKELRPLLQNIQGIDEIIADGEELPEFHVQCPLMRLPLVFDTTPETIPSAAPYIKANTELVKEWRHGIRTDPAGFRIGLSWRGNPDHSNDRDRSCSLEHFGLLSGLKNTIFYSLQKGTGAEQAKAPPEGMKLIDRTEDIRDFADAAAFIENLDLVISVDTAVAHLAGALGKPVWTILPFVPDWRWMLNRDDSPWYPAMRLFRQQKPNDWESVICSIVKELR